MASIDDFAKLEFKVGTIIEAEELEGSDKLLKLTVDFGSTPVIARSDNDEANQLMFIVKKFIFIFYLSFFLDCFGKASQ